MRNRPETAMTSHNHCVVARTVLGEFAGQQRITYWKKAKMKLGLIIPGGSGSTSRKYIVAVTIPLP